MSTGAHSHVIALISAISPFQETNNLEDHETAHIISPGGGGGGGKGVGAVALPSPIVIVLITPYLRSRGSTSWGILRLPTFPAREWVSGGAEGIITFWTFSHHT